MAMRFLHNAWYMGAWADELTEGPVGRMVVGEPVVLFRSEDGRAAALKDACPHRGVPLSLGEVEDELIACPYHGLRFDREGVCRKNPHVKGPPDRLKMKRFQVEERDNIIWVWMGEDVACDADLIPDYSLFSSNDGYVTVRGHLEIDADYRLVIDNLMDLAHAEYIHSDTVGTIGAAERGTAELVKCDGAVSVNALWPGSPPSGVFRPAWSKSELVDQYTDITWRAPANFFLDLAVTEPGEPRGSGLHLPSAHVLTPASERKTHYFWALARDFELQDAGLSAVLKGVVDTAFMTEDAPMIEAAQRTIDSCGHQLLNFSVGDAGSAEVRREIERRILAQ